MRFMSFSYRWEDVIKLARVVVEGQLPKPYQPATVEKKDCFPPLLAYEHKYNYKLKFLTDYNVMIFHPLTVTNLVVCLVVLTEVAAIRRRFGGMDASFGVFHRGRHSGEQSDSSGARSVGVSDSVAIDAEEEGGPGVRLAADASAESEAQGRGCGQVWESCGEGAVSCICGDCVGDGW